MRVVGRLRGVVLAGSLAAVVAGCSGSDDGLVGEPLDLDGGGAPPDAGIDDDGSGAPPGGSDDAPEGSEEPDYPPLPPIEPDPDLDLPIEAQADIAERHERFYELTQDALTKGGPPADELGALADPGLHETFVDDVTSRPDGHVSRNPDSEIRWVRFVEAGEDVAVIQECRVVGPLTGTYNDGELVSDPPDRAVARIFQTIYEPRGSAGFVAVSADVGDDPERCDV